MRREREKMWDDELGDEREDAKRRERKWSGENSTPAKIIIIFYFIHGSPTLYSRNTFIIIIFLFGFLIFYFVSLLKNDFFIVSDMFG